MVGWLLYLYRKCHDIEINEQVVAAGRCNFVRCSSPLEMAKEILKQRSILSTWDNKGIVYYIIIVFEYTHIYSIYIDSIFTRSSVGYYRHGVVARNKSCPWELRRCIECIELRWNCRWWKKVGDAYIYYRERRSDKDKEGKSCVHVCVHGLGVVIGSTTLNIAEYANAACNNSLKHSQTWAADCFRRPHMNNSLAHIWFPMLNKLTRGTRTRAALLRARNARELPKTASMHEPRAFISTSHRRVMQLCSINIHQCGKRNACCSW